MLLNKPMFIAFDGIDGCGKSTQSRRLYDYLLSKGVKTLLTKEPGGTKTGEVLRKILISKEFHTEPITEMLLYSADRLEHQKKVVVPKLKDNFVVISDRYISSTYAYQIFGRKLDMSILNFLEKITVLKHPDHVFIIDIDPAVAVERSVKRLKRDNKLSSEGKFESLPESFYKDVREGFIWYAKNFENCHILDGRGTSTQIFEAVKGILQI